MENITTDRETRVRDAEFYDRVVRERSPYSGVLEPARRPFPIEEPSADYATLAYHGRWLIGRTHIIAATLLAVLAGAIAFASLSDFGTAMANSVDKPAVQAASMAPSLGLQHTDATESSTPAESEAEEETKIRTIDLDRPLTATREISTPKTAVAAVAATPEIAAPETATAPKPATPEPTAAPEAAVEPSAGTADLNKDAYDELLVQAKKGSLKKRMALLKEAMETYPEGDEAPARLAVILMERPKERGEALILARRAVELNGGNAMAWLAIGYIQQMNGQQGEAQKSYRKCAQADGPARFVRDCKSLL